MITRADNWRQCQLLISINHTITRIVSTHTRWIESKHQMPTKRCGMMRIRKKKTNQIKYKLHIISYFSNVNFFERRFVTQFESGKKAHHNKISLKCRYRAYQSTVRFIFSFYLFFFFLCSLEKVNCFVRFSFSL